MAVVNLIYMAIDISSGLVATRVLMSLVPDVHMKLF